MAPIRTESRRVVIAGGGPAALEAALALQELAEERVAITLIAPEAAFVYRPLSVGEPFGGEPPRRFSLDALAAERSFELCRDTLASVRPDHAKLATASGATLGYDALVLAIGAEAVEAVPGAVTFRGGEDVALVRSRLLEALAQPAPRAAFVAAPPTAWTLPIYEMALLAVRWAQQRGALLDAWVVTHEDRPLALFGRQAVAEVTRLLDDAGVRLWSGAEAEVVEDGRLWLAMEGGLPVDLAVALARPVGRPMSGLPHDEHGFTPVDAYGRVPGTANVYAIGDMTTRPLKQGGLATAQADVAAAAIAAWAGADVHPVAFQPELRAVLTSGGGPRYLHRLPGKGTHRSSATADPSWWPPHKIAARHLGPYLASHPELELAVAPSQ